MGLVIVVLCAYLGLTICFVLGRFVCVLIWLVVLVLDTCEDYVTLLFDAYCFGLFVVFLFFWLLRVFGGLLFDLGVWLLSFCVILVCCLLCIGCWWLV